MSILDANFEHNFLILLYVEIMKRSLKVQYSIFVKILLHHTWCRTHMYLMMVVYGHNIS
jgi:hypothetical protein